MTGPAPRLGFFKITVNDAVASQRFYEQAFGMIASEPIVAQGFREHIVKTPDEACALILYQKDGLEVLRGNSYGPVGFYVPDMNAALERAKAAGATVQGEPQRFGEVCYVFLESPDGHVIELIESAE